MVLRERGVPFLREFVLSDRDHVDFLCGSVSITCKAHGSALALAQQVTRLQDAPEITTLIVVVTRERMTAVQQWVPASFTKGSRITAGNGGKLTK